MDYFKGLTDTFSKIESSDERNKTLTYKQAIAQIIRQIKILKKNGKTIFIVGNGGSASIAGHLAIDLLKNARIRAICFNDSSLLTCFSNDYGYEHVFQKPLEVLLRKGDMLLAISSSGRSGNIHNAVDCARRKGCLVVTMSGFSPKNPLRIKGKVNFYAPAKSYGYVEIAHSAICHHIADSLKI
jgi:D-sedoheptulose 7-phosphate isomerase